MGIISQSIGGRKLCAPTVTDFVHNVGANCVRPPAIIGPPTIIIVPPAGRFCRGELRSPTGNNQPTDNNNRPTGNNRPARFLGFWGDFWVIWAHAMRPYGFWGNLGLFGRTRCAPTGFWGIWVIWAHAMRPYGFLGYLGARDAPLRVLGEFGVIWAHAMRPYGFWGNLGIWAHAMRPYGFWTQRKAKNPRIKLI